MKVSERVSIVLVEPQSPGNVGMVCRAMKNMGLTKLRLVNPCPIDHPDAQKFAVSAKDLLAAAEIYPTLLDALADTSLSVATTRRHGKYRQEIISPDEAVCRILPNLQSDLAAFVFGREDSGLTTEEIGLCRFQATIPTSDEYGSLNLAQAVLLFCSELFNSTADISYETSRQLAPTAETEALFAHMETTLLRIGFLNPDNPSHLMHTLRRIFYRASLDQREVVVLRGMMSQIEWACDSFTGKK